MSARPLHGLRVVEMGSSVAGPYAGWIFSELGAEVIKVEDPRTGDATREWGLKNANGNSAIFESLNNGKKSVTVDLASEHEAGALKRLILDSVDIVLQNLRPGFAQQCGVGQTELTAAKPSLIYCDLGAYGKGGPLESLPGYDPLMQGFSGLAQGTGTEHSPSRVAAPVTDFMTGMWSVIGALSALHTRGGERAGTKVDVSLMESGIALMTMFVGLYQSTGARPERRGLQGPLVAPNGGFMTEDGLIMIVCGTNSLFTKLCEAIGRGDLIEDARFGSSVQRYANRTELTAEIESVLATKPREHWISVIGNANVPVAPVNHVDEMMAHPQARAVQIIDRLPGSEAEENAFEAVRLPVRFDGERATYREAGPPLGEHTADILGPYL